MLMHDAMGPAACTVPQYMAFYVFAAKLLQYIVL